MKITKVTKDINGKSIFLEWEKFPENTVQFRILFTLDDRITDFREFAYTSNPFFSDMINYSKTLLHHRVNYRIEALDSSGKTIDTLDILSDRLPKDLLQRTLNILEYKAHIALRNKQLSFPIYILKKRTGGAKCSKCYSRDLRASSDKGCPICFGTGFVGGYYDPIPSFLFPLQERIKSKNINEYVASSYDILRGTVPTFPGMQNGDYVIIEGEGRFHVTGGDTKAILSKKSPTRLVELSLLDSKDPIYKYNIKDNISKVNSVISGEGSIIVKGTGLVPIFGETKIIIWDDYDDEYEVYYGTHLVNISGDKLAFKSDKVFPPNQFKYRLRLNGNIFEGTTI